MKTNSPRPRSRLIILIRKTRFVANQQARLLEVPWIYHVTRMDGALRIGEFSSLPPPEFSWRTPGVELKVFVCMGSSAFWAPL